MTFSENGDGNGQQPLENTSMPPGRDQIQMFHDLLTTVLEQEFPEISSNFDQTIMESMRNLRATLCWVLGHPNGATTQNNFEVLLELFADAGIESYE